MKGMKKLALSLLAVFALALVIQVPTKAASGGVAMSGSVKSTSVTISWPVYTSSYRTVTGYVIMNNNQEVVKTVSGASTTSATVTGLSKGYSDWWSVYATYTYNGSSGTSYIGYARVLTTPATISKSNFGLTYLYGKQIRVGVKSDTTISGAQVQIYNLKTGKKYKSGNISKYYSLKYNTAYKYRVRAYYTNSDTAKTTYGSWSTWRYLSVVSGSSSYNAGSRASGITYKLKKGTGITKYKIQMSTKKDSGFKTVKTVKVGSKSTIKTTIKKISGKKFSKNKTYYVKIIPVLKGNKSSDTYGKDSFSFYK